MRVAAETRGDDAIRQRRQSPTINEVAKAAGVSRQTVSNALNAPERVRPDTLARVLATIDELGYKPNRMARSLRTSASRQIGYRLDPDRPDTASVLMDRFLHALTIAAQGAGYRLLLFSSDGTEDELAQYDSMLRTGSVDGFVLSGIDPGDPRPGWLAERQAPFVCFGRPGGSGSDAPWVDVDGAAGTEAVVDHLVAAGHHRIGFVGWPSGSGPGEARLSGWRRAMRRHGMDTGACAHALDTLPDSTRAAHTLLGRDPAPTAVVAATDTFAAGCYSAARIRGLTVGATGDLAVTGFDDSPYAALLSPPLTSVRQPLEDAVREVVRLLTSLLEGSEPDTSGVLLQPSLVVRESG